MKSLKINLFQPKVNFRQQLSWIIFKISFVTFFLLFLVDFIFPGFVTNWFNPAGILIIAVISGIISQEKQ